MSDDTMNPQQRPASSLGVPVAIVIAAALIAVAIYLSNGGNANAPAQNADDTAQITTEAKPIRGLQEGDHIRGNPDAAILMVEYSDYDCPFCSRFHGTLTNVLASPRGAAGEVAWVYRQFPLQALHPNAPAIAHASECVNDVAGNEAFWAFTDSYFSTGADDEAGLYAIVTGAGADETAVRACMDAGTHISAIQETILEAANAGGNGTPFTVFIFKDDMTDALRALVEQLSVQYRDSSGKSLFTTISDTQLSMGGALPEAIVNQIIEAQLGS
ncbi:thioredoxin domain-containing protein [Candidatus Kaiserbacteria bacterium]|nr:thioredoxin domain-containing protein [Candidatus Kaiserbacteria bacterium]